MRAWTHRVALGTVGCSDCGLAAEFVENASGARPRANLSLQT